jgi:hypothetical protein
MWKQIINLIQTVLTLAKDVEQYRSEIKEARNDILDLALQVQELKNEIKLIDQREAGERDKLLIKLENVLLKFEKSLGTQPAKQLKKKSGKK